LSILDIQILKKYVTIKTRKVIIKMFKYGVDLIREYVKETRDKLSDMFCNEEIDFESAKEREAVLCALQLTACLEKENDGMFIVVPKRVEYMLKEDIEVLREMGKKDDFFNIVANLLSITNLKMGFDQRDEILNGPSFMTNISNFKFDDCLDYAPPYILGEKESYFSTNSIPNRKRRKNIWGK
jgi:hypothetical protein